MRHIDFGMRTALLSVLLTGLGATQPVQEPPPLAAQDVALIVHVDNPLQDLKLASLRSYLRLDNQFWPGRHRVNLYLPAANSPAKQVLNDLIYNMNEKRLRKYWVGKVFSGDIPSVPRVIKTPAAAGKLVARSIGGISAVPASRVPKGVRVLKIGGIAPGEKGYPLHARPKSSAGTLARSR